VYCLLSGQVQNLHFDTELPGIYPAPTLYQAYLVLVSVNTAYLPRTKWLTCRVGRSWMGEAAGLSGADLGWTVLGEVGSPEPSGQSAGDQGTAAPRQGTVFQRMALSVFTG
jgi:hypothetical protein